MRSEPQTEGPRRSEGRAYRRFPEPLLGPFVRSTEVPPFPTDTAALHSAPRNCFTPYSLLLTPYSLLLTPYSLLLTPYSSLLTPHSLLLTPYSLLLTPYFFTSYFLPPLQLLELRQELLSRLSDKRIHLLDGAKEGW